MARYILGGDGVQGGTCTSVHLYAFESMQYLYMHLGEDMLAPTSGEHDKMVNVAQDRQFLGQDYGR